MTEWNCIYMYHINGWLPIMNISVIKYKKFPITLNYLFRKNKDYSTVVFLEYKNYIASFTVLKFSLMSLLLNELEDLVSLKHPVILQML